MIYRRLLTGFAMLVFFTNLSLMESRVRYSALFLLSLAGKTQLVLFDRSNNNGSIEVKMDGSLLEEKSSFKMLGLTFCSKSD